LAKRKSFKTLTPEQNTNFGETAVNALTTTPKQEKATGDDFLKLFF
jgi:hypothetical protein